MNKKKVLAFLTLGVGAYFTYSYMKKKIPSTGYIFPNGFSDLDNWQNADDGTDSPGNKKTKFMLAIAKAEGFGPSGNIASRANNPGDLTRSLGYDVTGETLGTAGIVVFIDSANGWAALEEQLTLIQDGHSIHKLTDTILQFAHGYTTTQQEEWAANVSAELGLDSATSLREVLS